MQRKFEKGRDELARPPILRDKCYEEASVFVPEGLLREARRQKGICETRIPELCVLDPDGDIVRCLRAEGRAAPVAGWACYHSEMYDFESAGRSVGIVGCAVGAPFAVLIAEQMFASGCRLLVSITSAGELAALGPRPYFVLIERALRDEGTSYHYAEPSEFSAGDSDLIGRVQDAISDAGPAVFKGETWTTDAPFRETGYMLERGRELGLAAVEMESAALYALAQARGFSIVCIAHVTNIMAVAEGDFEKGESGGAADALRIVEAVSTAFEEIAAG